MIVGYQQFSWVPRLPTYNMTVDAGVRIAFSAGVTRDATAPVEDLGGVRRDGGIRPAWGGLLRSDRGVPAEWAAVGVRRDSLATLEALSRVQLDCRAAPEVLAQQRSDTGPVVTWAVGVAYEAIALSENLALQRRDGLVDPTSVVAMRRDTVSVLELLPRVARDNDVSVEWRGSVSPTSGNSPMVLEVGMGLQRSDAALPLDSLLVVARHEDPSIEWRAMTDRHNITNVEALGGARSDLPAPAEATAQRSRDHALSLEDLAGLTRDTVPQAEALVGLRRDWPVPVLTLGNVMVPANSPAPLEFNSQVRRDSWPRPEVLAGEQSDAGLPAEVRAALMGAQSTLLTEVTMTRSRDSVARVEAAAQQARDVAVRLETLWGVRRDSPTRPEVLSSLVRNFDVPMEYQGTLILNVDARLPLEFRSLLRRDIPVPTEATQTARRDSPDPVASGSLQARHSSVRAEFAALSVATTLVTQEWLVSVRVDARPATEWESSVSGMSASDAVNLEWTVATSVSLGNAALPIQFTWSPILPAQRNQLYSTLAAGINSLTGW